MVGPWGYTLAQSFSCLQPHAKTSHKFFSNSQILKYFLKISPIKPQF